MHKTRLIYWFDDMFLPDVALIKMSSSYPLNTTSRGHVLISILTSTTRDKCCDVTLSAARSHALIQLLRVTTRSIKS